MSMSCWALVIWCLSYAGVLINNIQLEWQYIIQTSAYWGHTWYRWWMCCIMEWLVTHYVPNKYQIHVWKVQSKFLLGYSVRPQYLFGCLLSGIGLCGFFMLRCYLFVNWAYTLHFQSFHLSFYNKNLKRLSLFQRFSGTFLKEWPSAQRGPRLGGKSCIKS